MASAGIAKTEVVALVDQAGRLLLDKASSGSADLAERMCTSALFEAGLMMGISMTLKLPLVADEITDHESMVRLKDIIAMTIAHHTPPEAQPKPE